jgi:RNA polymerase sigma-70 factor (ECF subfamily)
MEDREGASGAAPAGATPESSPRLAEALNALPAEQREALQLAFFSGLSHSEIAAHTAQPLGTVKTRIRTAIEKLRQALGQQGNRQE